jgi:hypothetical protein
LIFFLRSVVAVLKLSEMERDLCNKGLFEYISVQVAVSLTWFIRRLAANYLGFDEQSYKDGNSKQHLMSNSFFCILVSQTLSVLLGKGSEMLEFLTNYFLSKVLTNLQMWASESDVIKETGLLTRTSSFDCSFLFSSRFIRYLINEKRIFFSNHKK